MNDALVQKIINYMDNVLIEPDHMWLPELFETWSNSRWACVEILNLLMDRPYNEADILIADFITRMSVYAMTTKNEKNRSRFMTAADVAEEILDLYLKGEYK